MIDKIILNYKITSQIGEGGMGKVYLGIHEKLSRKAAIKVLHHILSEDKDIRERFLNEAITLSKLNHTNIVTLFDYLEAETNLFLIMEYVEGKALDEIILKEVGAIPEKRCIYIFKQILNGFAYAHSKGIVHRDIKPSNIILQADDTPKILDFGIAKIIEGDKRLTKTGTRMGSVAYMSPEQILGKDVDHRSDIYSLGVTYFEMLTGRVPYDLDNKSEFEIQSKIVQEALPSVREMNPGLSNNYDYIIQKATAKNPHERFNSCEEFTESIGGNDNISKSSSTIIQPSYSSQQTIYQQSSTPLTNTSKKSNSILYLAVLIIIIVIGGVIFIVSRDDDAPNQQVVISNKTIQPNSGNNSVSKITESEINNFVRSWADAQSNKRISEYTSMYDASFNGVKRTKAGKTYNLGYSEWINDRTSMYNKARGLSVTYSDLNTKITSDNTAEVSFKQYYNSAQYSDEGHKILRLKKDSNGIIKIIFEELIYSTTGD